MQPFSKPAAAIALALSLALLGSAQGAEADIVITIKDHHFVPDDVVAPGGQKFKLVVRNESAMPSEFESVDFHREKVVPAGREITVFVGPLDPGSYEFFDDFHRDMRGRLTVK